MPPPLTIDLFSGTATIPFLHYCFTCASLLGGLALFTTGLVEAHRRGAIALFCALAVVYALFLLTLSAKSAILMMIMFLLLGLWCLSVAYPQIYRRRTNSKRQRIWIAFLPWFYFASLFAFISFVTIYFLMLEPFVFATLLVCIFFPLLILFQLASVEWAEINDALVRTVAKLLRSEDNNGQLFIALAAASAFIICITAYHIYEAEWAWARFIVFGLLGLIDVAVIFLLLRVARFQGAWPIQLPWSLLALAVGAITLPQVVINVNHLVAQEYSLLPVTITMGVLLCVCGRRPGLAWLAPTILFSVIAGLGATLSNFVSIYLLGQLPNWGDYHVVLRTNVIISGCNVTTATLLILGWALYRKKVFALQPLLRLLFILNCSLGLNFLLATLYMVALHAAESRIAVDALIFFFAIIWHILMSGHEITNIDGKWFPRRSRIYLFFSFVIITIAITLFWASVQGQVDAINYFRAIYNPDIIVMIGLFILGPAMIWTLFILRLGKWITENRPVAVDALATPTTFVQPI
jgi:hypothetical protein